MNAAVPQPALHVEPRHFRPPAAALRHFSLHLGRERATGKVSDAAFSYAVDEGRLAELVDRWCDDTDAAPDELAAHPWFRLVGPSTELCFVHRRASVAAALPLLVLHGYWGSLTELSGLVGPLSQPSLHGAAPSDAFHVVCPALPGFGVTRSDAALCSRELARSCATLMAELGYERYAVHGSDLGASVAAELAALAPEQVAAVHVTSLRAFPSEAPEELASLSVGEKSRLARLTLEHDELWHELPSSPIEDLGYALAQLDDWQAPPADFAPLLHSLTLAWACGDSSARRELCAREWLRPSPRFRAPVTLETYPLDAPCLRRFVERRYQVQAVIEHARGGRLAALEAPSELLASLRRSFRALR